MVLAGGTIVTLVNKANKCIRKVSNHKDDDDDHDAAEQATAGDNLSVHYTGRLGGPGGKVFDTSRNGGDDEE